MGTLYKGNKLISKLDVNSYTNVEGITFQGTDIVIDANALGAQRIYLKGENVLLDLDIKNGDIVADGCTGVLTLVNADSLTVKHEGE